MGVIVYDDENAEVKHAVSATFDITKVPLVDRQSLIGFLVIKYSIYDTFSIRRHISHMFNDMPHMFNVYTITFVVNDETSVKCIRDDILYWVKQAYRE